MFNVHTNSLFILDFTFEIANTMFQILSEDKASGKLTGKIRNETFVSKENVLMIFITDFQSQFEEFEVVVEGNFCLKQISNKF